MTTARLEAFSDGVFAIAITLLVLEIERPEPSSHLAHDLWELSPSYSAYGVSFLLIGVVWLNHHRMFVHITHTTDRTLQILNLLLLMDVRSFRFLTAVLAAAVSAGEGERTAAVLYGSTLVVGGIFVNAVWHYAAHEHRFLGDSISPAGAHAEARRWIMGPTLRGRDDRRDLQRANRPRVLRVPDPDLPRHPARALAGLDLEDLGAPRLRPRAEDSVGPLD